MFSYCLMVIESLYLQHCLSAKGINSSFLWDGKIYALFIVIPQQYPSDNSNLVNKFPHFQEEEERLWLINQRTFHLLTLFLNSKCESSPAFFTHEIEITHKSSTISCSLEILNQKEDCDVLGLSPL